MPSEPCVQVYAARRLGIGKEGTPAAACLILTSEGFNLDPEKEWPVGRLHRLCGGCPSCRHRLCWWHALGRRQLGSSLSGGPGLKCSTASGVVLAPLGEMCLGDMSFVVTYLKNKSFPSRKTDTSVGDSFSASGSRAATVVFSDERQRGCVRSV